MWMSLEQPGSHAWGLPKGSKHAGSPKFMDFTKLLGWAIKTSKIAKLQFTVWYFLTQIYPPNSRCLQPFFGKVDTASDWVTQSQSLSSSTAWAVACPGCPGSPCDWGSHIPQNPTEEDGCEQQHCSLGALPIGLWRRDAGRSPGRPGAGGRDSCGARRQPPTHNVCNAHSCCLAALQRCLTAAHAAAAMPAAAGRAWAIFYKFVCCGAASTGTLLWHPEHFAEWFGSRLLTRQHISRFRL